mmetsp:Transcript_26786/g.78001  ORF Transcript_26786/g.78001 Transcript_26786/m.78001 type:complete len:259 (+) Transcript_26786:2040-2816(+)
MGARPPAGESAPSAPMPRLRDPLAATVRPKMSRCTGPEGVAGACTRRAAAAADSCAALGCGFGCVAAGRPSSSCAAPWRRRRSCRCSSAWRSWRMWEGSCGRAASAPAARQPGGRGALAASASASGEAGRSWGRGGSRASEYDESCCCEWRSLSPKASIVSTSALSCCRSSVESRWLAELRKGGASSERSGGSTSAASAAAVYLLAMLAARPDLHEPRSCERARWRARCAAAAFGKRIGSLACGTEQQCWMPSAVKLP